jgi:hypothetical protein
MERRCVLCRPVPLVPNGSPMAARVLPVGANSDYRRNLASKESWSKDFLLGYKQRGRSFKLTHRGRVFLGIVLTFS